MKKLTALIVLLTVASTASFASGPLGENSQFKVIGKADTKYELIYVSSIESDVRVTILNAEGRNIESSTVKDVTKFRQTFDFSELKPGKYSIVVRNSEGAAREEVIYAPNKKKLQTIVAKIPEMNALKVHVGDFNAQEPVNVKIYDAQNRLIHRDRIVNKKAFSKIYNLKEASSGKFKILIENDGEIKSYIREVKE